MAQFVLIPSKISLEKPQKVSKRCYKNFDKNKFIQDLNAVNWNEHIDGVNVNDSISIFLKLFDSVLDNHAPFKQLTNKQIKLKNKPWITSGILKSIKIKDNIHKKFLKAKTMKQK